ncbi:MAG: helix-hairpin-helix domain-containing protein [Ignavibacteriales bacterium]|nr:MAG: helix-hairpin-helix domain-containing protein [Ignavibacteriales bacterium]
MKLKKISDLIGFTETEFKVTGFVVIALLAGLIIKFFSIEKAVYKQYDYKAEDSLFYQGKSATEPEEINVVTTEDSVKVKVLGLSENKFPEAKKKTVLKEKSLNLNTAVKEDLMNLPGIGEKTAENIIEFRRINGRYKSIDELMNVKGIQQTKFRKIEKYIYVK